MTLNRLAVIGLFSVTLAACASGGGGAVDPTHLTPAQSVYATQGVLTAALQQAANYASLPTCGAGASTLCSQPAIVAQIKAAAPAAVAAVSVAESAVAPGTATSAQAQQAAIEAAAQAVAQLTAITNTVRTQ